MAARHGRAEVNLRRRSASCTRRREEREERMHRYVVALISIIGILAGPARATVWEIDPAHTSAQFAIRHLMISTVRGTMGPVTGTANINDADLTQSSVQATIDVSGIDTRDAKRDEHLKSPDFFDVAKYPTITFTSTKVEKVADGTYKVTGKLTIKGTAKEVVLDLQGSPTPLKDPFGNVKLGGTAHTKINRQDFGVSWSKALEGGGLVVGDEVDITIDIELTQKKS
jgi:polyisoprenoid-binding protein YceI